MADYPRRMDRMSGTSLRVWLIGLGLALITFIAFEPVRYGEFLGFDDDKYVSANTHVQAGLTRDSVGWALRTSYFNNWHPLTWLSHMLDVELFGGDAAGAHHLSGLLLHVLNALLLFGFEVLLDGCAGDAIEDFDGDHV